MTSITFRRNVVRGAALSAAALLALTGCSAGEESAEQTSPTTSTSTAATESTAGESTDDQTTDGQSADQAADFQPGDCMMADPGIRDVSSFEKVDCEGEHSAEYLWAVPAAEEGAEEEQEGPSTAGVCRAQADTYFDDVEVTLSAAELRNSTDQSQHCVLYSVTDPWTGQVSDPEVTLEDALAQQ